MAYNCQTKNRFMMSDSESSDNEEVSGNNDPYALLNKKTQEASQRAKKLVKEQTAQKNAEKKAAEAAKKAEAEKQAEKEQKKVQNKRPPRANDGRRYGKRNQDEKSGEVADKQGEAQADRPYNNDRPRRGGNRRDFDRKSGNPNTSRRGQEKRGGAGTGNVGTIEDELTGQNEPIEETTPEAKNEDQENANPEAEEEEDKEPEIQELTLEEYMSGISADASEKKAARKANDGQEISGKQLSKKQVFGVQHSNSERNYVPRDNVKAAVSNDLIGFQSDYNRGGRGGRGGGRGGRGGNRGGRRDFNDRQGGNQGQKNQQFNLEQAQDAFPSLGK